MGGAAFIIHGTMNEVKLEQFRRKPGFFERLFSGKNLCSSHVEYDISNKKMKELNALTEDFIAFVDEIKEPWHATKEIMTYLKDIGVNVYFRKNRATENENEASYIQISFSGCAGLAETSAYVAAHWAEIWYARHKDRLCREIFPKLGFIPVDTQEEAESDMFDVFFPLSIGYAMVLSKEYQDEPDEEDSWRSSIFDIDYGVRETISDEYSIAYSKQAEKLFRELVSDGCCRCQLCTPGFDIVISEQLPQE